MHTIESVFFFLASQLHNWRWIMKGKCFQFVAAEVPELVGEQLGAMLCSTHPPPFYQVHALCHILPEDVMAPNLIAYTIHLPDQGIQKLPTFVDSEYHLSKWIRLGGREKWYASKPATLLRSILGGNTNTIKRLIMLIIFKVYKEYFLGNQLT